MNVIGYCAAGLFFSSLSQVEARFARPFIFFPFFVAIDFLLF